MTDLDPTRCLSAPPGADGILLSRREIRDWLRRVEATTDRLRGRIMGTSTEGRPLDAVFIADDLSGTRLDALLAAREATVRALLRGQEPPAWDLPIVLITSGIHATEAGGPQGIPELIHWLVADEAPEVREIRRRVLTIVVPTLNPDGMDLVQRWHAKTQGTSRAGSLPPLLYHRHAGHDNNRDWLYRNLAETRVVLDALHRPLLPHVTLDQHQMNPTGPRFVLPPYADPWEPHIHPAIVAAAAGLGQAIATDLTLDGLAGITTGRYFDAWEPSRAIQHYRGGVRILAEAASAKLAWPIEIGAEQLGGSPLPQEATPTAATPRPWPGGTWRLRDILDHHLAAARSLLRHVAADPERWLRVQREALGEALAPDIPIRVPLGRPALDLAANQRLAEILADADLGGEDAIQLGTPPGRLAAALLLPRPFPDAHGDASYDVTTHHLPLLMGAVVVAGDDQLMTPPASPSKPWLVIDARSHRAPELAETAILKSPEAAMRVHERAMDGGTLLEAGAWLIDREAVPEALHALAHAAIDAPPAGAKCVNRRDLVLLAIGDEPTSDLGWTRWWLEARRMPYLDADSPMLASLIPVAASTTALIPDTPVASLSEEVIAGVQALLDAGAHVIAFGQAGRSLASELSREVGVIGFPTGGPVRAPGVLLRLVPRADHPIALGLDRAIPAMVQRDGVFALAAPAADVTVLARFAARDPVISGWMSHPEAARNAAAIVEIQRGAGRLHAFAFRPLFRGQALVTAPLLHNLIYCMETAPCPPLARAKRSATATSAPTS